MKICITTIVPNPSRFTVAAPSKRVAALGAGLTTATPFAVRVSPEQLGAPAALLPSKAGSAGAESRQVVAAARPGLAAVAFLAFSVECIAKVAAGAALATLTLEFSRAFAVTHFLEGQSKYSLFVCLKIKVYKLKQCGPRPH